MYCAKCGNQMRDDAKFCPICGTATGVANNASSGYAQAGQAQNFSGNQGQSQQSQYQYQGQYQYQEQPQSQPQYENPQEKMISDMKASILTFGILSLSFAVSFFASFMGIIFGAITAGKVRDYIALMGETTGRATVGKNLGKAGLIVGIILTVLFILYIILIVVLVSETSSYYYDDPYYYYY